MTRDDLENDEVFSAAVNGLPKVVELITAAPEEKRSLALAAAHQAYLRTAQELGYDESDAQQWASAVMSLIVTSNELILSRVAADLLGRPSVLPERFNAPADCASLIHATRLYPALTFGASATAPAASQSSPESAVATTTIIDGGNGRPPTSVGVGGWGDARPEA
jgi:hypothetical protein